MRSSDVDVVWTAGYGFPRYRGGPLFYADSIGLETRARRDARISGHCSARCTGSRRPCSRASCGNAVRSRNGTPRARIEPRRWRRRRLERQRPGRDRRAHARRSVVPPTEPDEVWKDISRTPPAKYFKAGKRPTIARDDRLLPRAASIGLVMFTVDTEFEIGVRRIPNQEVADAARENSDIMMAFAQHRSAQGQAWACAKRGELIKDGGIRGLQVPPDRARASFPNDRVGLSALRGHRRAQAAGDLPQRALGDRHRHAAAAAACG